MFRALANPPDPTAQHVVRPELYRPVVAPKIGRIRVQTPFYGIVNNTLTNQMQIAYTQWGDAGPLVLLLHGVPTNRRQWYGVQERLAPFCRTISIDMLGMGESDKPLQYGQNEHGYDRDYLTANGIHHFSEFEPWDWIFDTVYIRYLMTTLYGKEPFVFIADDWGGGIAMVYASVFPTELLAWILGDPIAFDGYPVNEIQAIGRASRIRDENMFRQAFGAFDQTLVQIYKTMVHKPGEVYNQYSLRDITFPYMDVDYERVESRHGEDASSLTMHLHWTAIRVLADRAAILSPALLLPYDSIRNRKGIRYDRVVAPGFVFWGAQDNMMPAMQIYRYIHACENAHVLGQLIEDAGHFASTDQPERVTEAILLFLMFILKPQKLGDVFLGYKGIWKGDEQHVLQSLRAMYAGNAS